MEKFYFDVLPREITESILHDLDFEFLRSLTLKGSGIISVDTILKSSSFWNLHVKLEFPDVPFEYVPLYKYKYDNQDIVSILDNFRSFSFEYRIVKVRIDYDKPVNREFYVANITNAKFLIDIISPYYKTAEELYNFFSERWRGIIITTSKTDYKLTFEEKIFSITRRQAFGLLLHIFCNNHSEYKTS